MSDLIQLGPNERIEIQLVPADEKEFLKHRNEVAAITNNRLVFLKRKVVGAYYSVEYIDLVNIHEVTHSKRFGIGGLIGGGLLVIMSILLLVFFFMGQLTGLGVVMFPLVFGGFGLSLIFGVKRRKLVFQSKDQAYSWVSGPRTYRKSRDTIKAVEKLFADRGVRTVGFDEA